MSEPGGPPSPPGSRTEEQDINGPPVLNASTEMRVHLGDRGTALMRFSESRHAFSLDLLVVPSPCRGEGLGTALVHRLFAIADAMAKPVHTTARPIGQASEEAVARLVRYYQRLGFFPVEEGFQSVHMKRPVPSGIEP